MSSHLEDAFEMWLGQNPSIPEPEVEFKFQPQEAVALRLRLAWPHGRS